MIRAIDYVDLLQHSARCAGLDPAALSPDEFRDLRLFHCDRLQRMWEMRDWPDLCPTEKRYFRDLYAAATSYAAGAEVYFPGPRNYFQMLRTGGVSGQPPATQSGNAWHTNLDYWAESQTSYAADEYDNAAAYVKGEQVYYSPTDRFYQLFTANSTGNLPTDTTRWGVLTEFDQYVAYAQTGRTPFDEALGAWDKDPENNGDARPLNCFLSPEGAQVLDSVAFCWLRFRRRTPDLRGDAYDETLAYAPGDQIYFASGTTRGNFYDCLSATTAGQTPITHPAKWAKVEIPLAFRAWLIHGAASDYNRPDGNLGVADREERLATEAREQIVSIFDAQAAHLHRTVVLTR